MKLGNSHFHNLTLTTENYMPMYNSCTLGAAEEKNIFLPSTHMTGKVPKMLPCGQKVNIAYQGLKLHYAEIGCHCNERNVFIASVSNAIMR